MIEQKLDIAILNNESREEFETRQTIIVIEQGSIMG